MDIDIRCKPSYSIGYIVLDHGETVFVERRAMAAMSGGVTVVASTGGSSVAGALIRQVASGESFVFAAYTADVHQAWIAVAPPFPGDVETVELADTGPIVIEQGALLAYAATSQVNVKFAGAKAVVMREGVTFVRASGQGPVLIASYGGIERFELGSGETLIVDSGHLVGFTESTDMTIGTLGSVITSQLTGEGLVAKLTGPGIVWMQTRSEAELGSWLFPERRQNQK